MQPDDEFDEIEECSICGGIDGEHELTCPENIDPFSLLIREGFD